MQILSKRSTRVVMGLALLTFVALIVASAVSAAPVGDRPSAIWTDADRKAAVDKVANAWGGPRRQRQGRPEAVRQHPQRPRDRRGGRRARRDHRRARLDRRARGQRPRRCRSIPKKAMLAQFPNYTLDAFSYGTAVKKLYGVPDAVENIGLVVNTKLAKVPKTLGAAREAGARVQEEEGAATSASPSSRARAATRTTCTRSSRASAATSSARTRRGNLNP